MKGYIKRAVITALSIVMLAGSAMPALAEEGKSLDDMTMEELRIAYLELQLENEILKNELNSLKGGDAQDEAEAESAEAVWMDTEEFEQDIVTSYNDRAVISQRYTTEEVNAMSQEDYVAYYYEAVSAESDFYDKYRNALFDDLNIQYLCGKYIEGLSLQFGACQLFFDTADIDAFNQDWRAGYNDRAAAVVELTDFYDLYFGDISNMRSDVEAADSSEEAELANAALDAETILYVQQMLNEIGFYCGEADGISGERTARSIMHFQEMFGYEPADGVIDDELLGQLEAALY